MIVAGGLGLMSFGMYQSYSFHHAYGESINHIIVGTSTLPIATTTPISSASSTMATSTASSTAIIPVTHMKTPKDVKALYMTSWVAGTKIPRDRIVKLVQDTEANALVIDVKDNTGVVTWEGRVKDDQLRYLINDLHAKNIYVIGRLTAFQDPLYAKNHPDEAIQKATGTPWKDKKGVAWVDPGSHAMWDYLLKISEEAYARGFDEINLDYIRFSTEGYNEHLIFPKSGIDGKSGREKIIGGFYKYISEALHKNGIPVSGDVFGIITTSKADIPVLGQDLHDALTYFDYVAPMIYPSHYAPGTFGYQNPAKYPKEVITEAMRGAFAIADQLASSTGQSTTTLRNKFRPWYQDFNLGAVYDAPMVRAQITAGENLGINSWMMWDPNNRYTTAALRAVSRDQVAVKAQ